MDGSGDDSFGGDAAIEVVVARGGDEEMKSTTRARAGVGVLPATPSTIFDSMRSSLRSRSCSPVRMAESSSRTGAPLVEELVELLSDLAERPPVTRRATRSAIDLA